MGETVTIREEVIPIKKAELAVCRLVMIIVNYKTAEYAEAA